eukprot:SAG22_NODE_1_length_62449_cov_158.689270_13_plen_49_part_00
MTNDDQISEKLLRLSIGMEAPADLIADLTQGVRAACGVAVPATVSSVV